MTGFGQAAGENGRFRIQVTLRGYNHRFLDLVLRLREEYREAEAVLRGLLTDRLHRGRVEVGVEVEPLGTPSVRALVSLEAAQALQRASAELVERGIVTAGATFGDLLRLPQLVRLEVEGEAWGEPEQRLLTEVVGRALEQLEGARQQEGASLRQALVELLGALEETLQRLVRRSREQPGEIRRRLQERIGELLEVPGVEEARLAQEVALLVDRSDVREELDRLAAHLEHFRGLLRESTGSLGKRLDFLAQEILRELNTVAAKCRDAELTAMVLEGKATCERIREQVQNVE